MKPVSPHPVCRHRLNMDPDPVRVVRVNSQYGQGMVRVWSGWVKFESLDIIGLVRVVRVVRGTWAVCI